MGITLTNRIWRSVYAAIHGEQQVSRSQDVLDGWELWGGKVPLKWSAVISASSKPPKSQFTAALGVSGDVQAEAAAPR